MLTTGVVSYHPIVNDRFSRNSTHCSSIKEWKVVVNVFEHFNNFPLLLAGRVLGGVPCHKLWKTEVIDFHLKAYLMMSRLRWVHPFFSLPLSLGAWGIHTFRLLVLRCLSVFESTDTRGHGWCQNTVEGASPRVGWQTPLVPLLGYENFWILRFRNFYTSPDLLTYLIWAR